MTYPGLEDAFLRYIQATPKNIRQIQSFYIPFFANCQNLVVDLACGHGDFVQLLTEHGVETLGVDSDAACCAAARQRGINIVCKDVFDYLGQVEENSLCGVFSAHLVEHLPYQKVMELIHLSYQALKPGGVILLATPNVRGLYPHLESFYMHFGHVMFYHPKLLSFFLDYFGFSNPRVGENPRMAHPLWRGVTWIDPDDRVKTKTDLSSVPLVCYSPQLTSKFSGFLGRLVSSVKMFAVRLVVQPLLDRVIEGVNRSLQVVNHDIAYHGQYLHQLNTNVNATHQQLLGLDRSVECYVYATKGETNLCSDLPLELVGEKL